MMTSAGRSAADAGGTRTTGQSTLLIWLIALLGAGAFASIPIIVITLEGKKSLFSDVIFPVILVGGLVALIAAIALLVSLLRALGLEDRRFALGMPDGSIRAIIAVMLILLFAMMAVFLYIDTAAGGGTNSLEAISKETLDAIPGTQLIRVRPSRSDPTRFDATVRLDRSQASSDIAKQLVTTVSTLVVAISAFYFGAQSVESARRRTAGAGTPTDQAGTPTEQQTPAQVAVYSPPSGSPTSGGGGGRLPPSGPPRPPGGPPSPTA
jgi:hypothetical protein